jgi:fimbrial isopeptide formation D2 family protein
VSGTSPAQCSATKPSPETPGTGTIDKTLISPQYVTKIGEQVTWKIVVTARNGAISNFTITDKLPAELELAPFPYYTVLVSNGVTVNTPTVNGNTITWTTSGSLAKDKTIEIELRTKVKSMPKDTVRNVACLKIGNNPELCDNPPINPSCNSSYHGQEVESLTSGDYLCNFGTISNFTPTTSGGIVT